MTRLQDILEVEVEETSKAHEVQNPTLDMLEKTADYLKDLSIDDREVDTAAKQAVVEDMLKEAGYMWDSILGKFVHSRAARASLKRVSGAEKALVAAKNNQKADKLLAKAEAVKNGEEVADISKLLGYAGTGVAGLGTGYYLANKSKENELKEVAKKYYQAGKEGK